MATKNGDHWGRENRSGWMRRLPTALPRGALGLVEILSPVRVSRVSQFSCRAGEAFRSPTPDDPGRGPRCFYCATSPARRCGKDPQGYDQRQQADDARALGVSNIGYVESYGSFNEHEIQSRRASSGSTASCGKGSICGMNPTSVSTPTPLGRRSSPGRAAERHHGHPRRTSTTRLHARQRLVSNHAPAKSYGP